MSHSKSRVKNIFIRVDASKSIGTGHLLRSLALAQQARRSGYSVAFITRPYLPRLIARIKRFGFTIHKLSCRDRWNWQEDAAETIKIMKNSRPQRWRWLILDNYFFDYKYQKLVKYSGNLLACIDDIAKTRFFSDIVINHSISAEYLDYKTIPGTKLLLGTQYFLLRDEFLKDKTHKKQKRENGWNILVTLGGTKKEPYLCKIYNALLRIKDMDLNIKTATGSDYMPRLYRWADLVISTASTSALEASFYGLTGVVCTSAENQESTAKRLHRDNIFFSVEGIEKTEPSDIAARIGELILNRSLYCKMSRNARALIDGKGPQRIIAQMKVVENAKG